MKNNITTLRIAAALLMAGTISVMTVGCVKDNASSLRLVAEKHHGGSKTSVDGVSVYWVEGDKVNINGSEYTLNTTSSTEASVEVTDYENATLISAYPAEAVTALSESHVELNLPGVYTYSLVNNRQEVAFPMAAKGVMQAGGELRYKHLCAAVKVTVSNTSPYPLVMNSIIVSSDASQLSGPVSIDLAGIDASDFSVPAVATDNASLRSVMLTFGVETVILSSGQSASFDIPILPVASGDHLHFTINAGEKKIPGVSVTGVYKYTSNDITVTQNVQRSQLIATPDIPIAGDASNITYYSSKVTVNASGKQVYFSQGDLEYNTTNDTWQFGEESDSYTSFNVPPIYDIFRFGNCTGSNPEAAPATADLTGSTEWGNLPITNGGNIANNGWRTPSLDEYTYMLKTRTTNITINGISNCHFLQCKVISEKGPVKGLVVFPDNFADNMPVDIDYSGWNANNLDTRREGGVSYNVSYVEISADDWAKLCRVGCNFLVEDGWFKDEGPANDHSYQGDAGIYWTSTMLQDSKMNNAYVLYFNNQGVTLKTWRNDGPTQKQTVNGMTVRLVRDVETTD